MLIKASDVTVDGDRVMIVMSLTEGPEELAVVAHMTGDQAQEIGKALSNAGARVERHAPKTRHVDHSDRPF